MNYADLNSNTQVFLNKAIDIYSTIEDRKIRRKDKVTGEYYEFSKEDKKVLSLFLAGFLIDGDLKLIFSQHSDIKLNKLLNFIGINQNDIKPLEDQNYEEYFTKNFMLDIMPMIDQQEYIVNSILPEGIVSSLFYADTDILEKFANSYGSTFENHPLFGTLDYYNLLVGGFSQRENVETNDDNLEIESKETIVKVGEGAWKLLDEIKEKYIGQEEAAEELFYNIVNNQRLVHIDDVADGERSIIFMDGPTGTGKTAITKEITEKLGIPILNISLGGASSTGYIGGEIGDVLCELYMRCNGDINAAQRGIIVFDEFDRIAYSRPGEFEMQAEAQQQLLDLFGGDTYTIDVGDSIFSRTEIQFDTSKLTFICLGSLNDFRSYLTNNPNTIGFKSSEDRKKQEYQNYSLDQKDLIEFGIDRELAGRINVFLHTKDYNIEDLEAILKNSTISPLYGFKKWVESSGKDLIIDDDVYNLIAKQAHELGTGARSLQTVLNNIRTKYMREVLRGQEDTVKLDKETIEEINKQIQRRKTRD